MEHLAIMKKDWKLIDKILSGKKKIESRWYKSRYPPWDKIKQGEVVYFKDSGNLVSVKAEVEKVLQFSDLNEPKVKEIIDKYAQEDGIEENKQDFFNRFKNKKYCMLIFLKNIQRIEPFDINKKGFGAMAAWICVENINKIRK